MAGQEMIDVLEHRMGHAAEHGRHQIFQEGRRVGAWPLVARRHDGLGLRREDEFVARTAVDERLDAQPIARAPAAAGDGVPQKKAEHAVEPRQRALAPADQRGQQHLGVRPCDEAPRRRQLRAQLGTLIELAVVDEDVAPVGADHGLRAADGVDDREPIGAEAGDGARPPAGAVGTAMGLRRQEPANARRIGTARKANLSRDGAHFKTPSRARGTGAATSPSGRCPRAARRRAMAPSPPGG